MILLLAYYPYPAYGTCDEASLPGSTPSLYYPDVSDGKDPTIGIPQNIPVRPRHSQTEPPYLSTSCPVVTSQLKGVRDSLHERGKAQPGDESEVNSLRNSLKSRESLTMDKSKMQPSFNASSTSSGSHQSSLLDDYVGEKDGDPTQPMQPSKRLPGDKNRILSATPPKNMVSRQVRS